MAPHFALAAAHLPDVRFVKVDTGSNPQASKLSHILSIPTLILYRGGKQLARHSGAMASDDLVRWVRLQLSRGP